MKVTDLTVLKDLVNAPVNNMKTTNKVAQLQSLAKQLFVAYSELSQIWVALYTQSQINKKVLREARDIIAQMDLAAPDTDDATVIAEHEQFHASVVKFMNDVAVALEEDDSPQINEILGQGLPTTEDDHLPRGDITPGEVAASYDSPEALTATAKAMAQQ